MEGSEAGDSGDSVAFIPLGEEVAPDGTVGLRLRADDFERAQNFGETFGIDIFMRSFNVQVRHI